MGFVFPWWGIQVGDALALTQGPVCEPAAYDDTNRSNKIRDIAPKKNYVSIITMLLAKKK